MTLNGYKCDGCGKFAPEDDTANWIAIERRGGTISFSTNLYTCSTYKHYCQQCAENGISA